MELYYVDNGCIIPNICFSLYKAKYGLLLKMYDLPNDFDSHNPVNDTCAVGTGTKNKRIGKRPNTKELFYLLSFCLKKASEKYDISNIKIIAVSSDVFPEISIQCTNLLKKVSSMSYVPNEKKMAKAMNETSLRAEMNKLFKPYDIKVKDIIVSQEKGNITMETRDNILKNYNVDENILIPDTILNVWTIITMISNDK